MKRTVLLCERLSVNIILHFQDHIQEVLNKWESIDDEIWAKVCILPFFKKNTLTNFTSH